MGLFDNFANQNIPENTGPEIPPDKTWFLVDVVRTGKAAPRVEQVGNDKLLLMKGAFQIVGGPEGQERFEGRMVWLNEFVIDFNTQGTLSPTFMRLMNCCLSPGVASDLKPKDPERHKARQAHTFEELEAFGQEKGINEAAYESSNQMAAAVFALLLNEQPKRLLIQTRYRYNKEDQERLKKAREDKKAGKIDVLPEIEPKDVTAGQYEDNTPEMIQKHSIKVYGDPSISF